jgi:3-dehydroquinate synthase
MAPASPDTSASGTRMLVDLGPRSYEIQVVTGLTAQFAAFVRAALERTWAGRSCSRALVLTDAHLADRSLPEPYQAALSGAGIDATTLTLPPGERTKSLACAAQVYDELVRRQADRHVLVVALGGGVIGDLAGFVAATFARGVPLVMVPTTLLAQVDSAIGGKVGINHPHAKNIIGAFYQPLGVWIDTDTLASLPERELRAGLAEVVKYGAILDAAFFAELEQHADQILTRQPQSLRRIIVRSCQLKAAVVARDEREESGQRAILNFGHTVGHAIESATDYDGRFLHGEAVAVGMVAESRLAARLGWIQLDIVDRLTRLLERFDLPTSAAGLDTDRLLAAIARDKKNRQGKVRFVLPRAIGAVELTDAPTDTDVKALLETL